MEFSFREVCFFKGPCTTWPGTMPVSASDRGVPHPKESGKFPSLDVARAHVLRGKCPFPTPEMSLTAASLGSEVDFVQFLYMEVVALSGSSFLQKPAATASLHTQCPIACPCVVISGLMSQCEGGPSAPPTAASAVHSQPCWPLFISALGFPLYFL